MLNQNKKIISSMIPIIRRNESAPRTPPMIVAESGDCTGLDVISSIGSEATVFSKKVILLLSLVVISTFELSTHKTIFKSCLLLVLCG